MVDGVVQGEAVEVTIQYFEGCPNRRVAEARLREALRHVDRSGASVLPEQIETAEKAARVGFRGSPTILIDGQDPFSAGGPPGLACRVYPTERGAEGAPSVGQLVAALGGSASTANTADGRR